MGFASSFSDLQRQALHSVDNLDGLRRKYLSSASLVTEQYDGGFRQRSISMQSLTGKHNPRYRNVKSKVVEYIAAIKEQSLKAIALESVETHGLHLTWREILR